MKTKDLLKALKKRGEPNLEGLSHEQMAERLLGAMAADESTRMQVSRDEAQMSERAEEDEVFGAMVSHVKKMKKGALVKELEKRGLDTSGKQPELTDRLLRAMVADRAIAEGR